MMFTHGMTKMSYSPVVLHPWASTTRSSSSCVIHPIFVLVASRILAGSSLWRADSPTASCQRIHTTPDGRHGASVFMAVPFDFAARDSMSVLRDYPLSIP